LHESRLLIIIITCTCCGTRDTITSSRPAVRSSVSRSATIDSFPEITKLSTRVSDIAWSDVNEKPGLFRAADEVELRKSSTRYLFVFGWMSLLRRWVHIPMIQNLAPVRPWNIHRPSGITETKPITTNSGHQCNVVFSSKLYRHNKWWLNQNMHSN